MFLVNNSLLKTRSFKLARGHPNYPQCLREINESDNDYMKPLLSPFIDAKNWTKTLESLEEYLKGRIGVKGVPLSCVLRS